MMSNRFDDLTMAELYRLKKLTERDYKECGFYAQGLQKELGSESAAYKRAVAEMVEAMGVDSIVSNVLRDRQQIEEVRRRAQAVTESGVQLCGQ